MPLSNSSKGRQVWKAPTRRVLQIATQVKPSLPVYEGQDKKLRKSVAVKVYEKKKINTVDKRKMVQTEIDMHRFMLHPNIIKLLKVVEDSKHLLLVQE